MTVSLDKHQHDDSYSPATQRSTQLAQRVQALEVENTALKTRLAQYEMDAVEQRRWQALGEYELIEDMQSGRTR